MSFKSKKIAVLGGGSFGTVLANIISENNHRVCLWLRNKNRADALNSQQENSYYLPGYVLSDDLCITADIEQAMTDCEQLYVAVPSTLFEKYFHKRYLS